MRPSRDWTPICVFPTSHRCLLMNLSPLCPDPLDLGTPNSLGGSDSGGETEGMSTSPARRTRSSHPAAWRDTRGDTVADRVWHTGQPSVRRPPGGHFSGCVVLRGGDRPCLRAVPGLSAAPGPEETERHEGACVPHARPTFLSLPLSVLLTSLPRSAFSLSFLALSTALAAAPSWSRSGSLSGVKNHLTGTRDFGKKLVKIC